MTTTKKTSEWALRVQLEREELRVDELQQQNRRLSAELQRAKALCSEIDRHRSSAHEFARQNRELFAAGQNLQLQFDELAGEYRTLTRRAEELALELQKERSRHTPMMMPRPAPVGGGGILN